MIVRLTFNLLDAEEGINKSSKAGDNLSIVLLLGMNLSIKSIAAYLCERKTLLDKDIQTIPLLILKMNKTRAILYKNTEHDANFKLQVNTMIVVDNSFVPPPFYSFDYRPEDSKTSLFFKHTNLIKSKEDCEYFITNHRQNVILYKEEGLKDNPIITVSGRVCDKDESIESSDMESESTINIGINGIIIRPELHTKAFNKLANLTNNTESMEFAELSNTKSMSGSVYGYKSSSKKLPVISRQVLKVNLCLRNFTLDIWPTVELSNLMEVDPPALPPKYVTDNKQLYRVRQRILFLFDNLTLKYISAPFINKQKLLAHLINTTLAVTNCTDLKQTLLVDNEALLNSTISMLRKVGYSNLLTLDSLEINYTSHNESLNNKQFGSVKADMSTLMVEMHHDSLVAAIKGTIFLLSEIENLTTSSVPSKVNPTKEVETYELNQEKVKEELKFTEDLGKSTIFEDLEVVKQTIEEEKATMRKVEKIDPGAMKDAFRIMNENPDYLTKEELVKKEPEVKVDETTTLINSLKIKSDYIEKPKEIIHQYETKFHALPEGYDSPKTIFCLSIAKIGVAFIDGSDLEVMDSKHIKSKKEKADSSIEISLQNIGVMITQFHIRQNPKMLRATFSLEKFLGLENLSQSEFTTLLKTVNTDKGNLYKYIRGLFYKSMCRNMQYQHKR